MARPPVLTPQAENFPQWYQDVLDKAELASNGPARGTMVIRPYAYAIWERMQAQVDRRIKAAGAENVYFPLFIPNSYLEREAEHVEGFSPELAIVTHAGGKELAEPLVVRPTSETVFGEMMANWIQGHRDLPLLLNQWANVVRWELRPRTFLRTSEFLWQEGHTAHATRDDASAYARLIHESVYHEFLTGELAISVLLGRKTAKERFAGATDTLTCEAMMGDGKALQLATSHELGQNFAEAFDMNYLDVDGERRTCWTTSWGSSTRMVGGLIMAHGDDRGLVLPPRIAPFQVVIVPVRDQPEVMETVDRIATALGDQGVRVRVDRDTHLGLGRRVTAWELKGVPLRIEIGPRDLESGSAVLIRRDTAGKSAVPIDTLASTVPDLLVRIQHDITASARRRTEERTVEVDDLDSARAVARHGFARLPWNLVGVDGEASLAEDALTVRCLQREDGSLPRPEDDDDDLLAVVARAY
ncbi:MAG: proline--tRNA ligase [Microthrixaceae bacterium]